MRAFLQEDQPCRRRPMLIAAAWSALAVLTGLPAAAEAHEGHAPLPTKGAQVDVEKGTVTLSADARKALGVEIGEVSLRPIERSVLAYANVSLGWQQHRFVTTPIAGRIAKLHIKPGQEVRKDEMLAEIESTELANLQLQLLNAQNATELSSRTLARTQKLAKEHVIAGQELIEAEAAHRENEAAVEIGKSKLGRLRLTDAQIDAILRSRQPIRSLAINSPMSGVAIHTDLALGKYVEPTEHLFEVMDLSSVAVRIDVLERDLGKVHVGQPVRLSVTAFPQKLLEGKVETKEAYIDPVTHLGRVWVRLPNASSSEFRLLPGMYGQAQITVSPPGKKLTAPNRALLTNGTEWFVLVEEAATAGGSEYRKRNVAVGDRNSEFTEIIAGDVFPGDRVVTTGGHEMANFFVQGVLQLSPEARQNLGVAVEPVGRKQVDQVLEVDGAIDLPPEQRAVASSQLAGTIESILVDRGQSVQAGDVIAEVSSLELQEAQLELLQAHVQLGLLESNLKRLRQLSSQIIAQKRLQEAESLYDATLYRRNSARQRLSTMGLSAEQIEALQNDKKLVEMLPVRASIDGVIVRLDKLLGQVVQADEPLFEIHDLSHIVVRAHLGERDLQRVPVGTTARVRVVADPAFVAEGEVVRGGSMLGQESRTASAWVDLAEESTSTLYHGMLARVTFTLDSTKQVLAVPKTAVVRQGTRTYVFVQDQSGLLARRPVQIGRADDRFVQITAGLQPGELVATKGAASLQTAHASLR